MKSLRHAALHVRELLRADRRMLGRDPRIWFPSSITTPEVLARRRAENAPTPVREGVTMTRRSVPATDGRPAVDVLIHEPSGRRPDSPAVFWIHGGGMISGRADSSNDLASGWAADLGVLVVSATYRLAPEHPYPAAIDDVHAGYAWLVEHAAELGVDPQRIAVAGGSAGGGLAAALAQRAYDEGLPVAFQLLLAPMLDDRTVPRAEADGTWALAWTLASNRYGWASYLGHEPGATEERPYAVPARRADLSGLAPAWISVGAIDLFHDEDVAYAERLRAAGVPCEIVVVPGMHHAGERFTRHPAVADLIRRRTDALRRGLGLS